VLMARFDQIQDHESIICLRYSMITCLTSIAELHDLMASPGNNSGAVCRGALSQLIGMTERLAGSDYYLLDPFVGVSCIRSLFYPFVRFSSLRYAGPERYRSLRNTVLRCI